MNWLHDCKNIYCYFIYYAWTTILWILLDINCTKLNLVYKCPNDMIKLLCLLFISKIISKNIFVHSTYICIILKAYNIIVILYFWNVKYNKLYLDNYQSYFWCEMIILNKTHWVGINFLLTYLLIFFASHMIWSYKFRFVINLPEKN